MKKLTDQEYTNIVMQINKAIDNHFFEDSHYAVALTDAEYKPDERTGMHVFTLRVVIDKHMV